MPRGDSRRRRQNNAKKALDEKQNRAPVTTFDKRPPSDSVDHGDEMSASMRKFMSLKAAAATNKIPKGGIQATGAVLENMPKKRNPVHPGDNTPVIREEERAAKPTGLANTATKEAPAGTATRREKTKEYLKSRTAKRKSRKHKQLPDAEEKIMIQMRMTAPKFGEQAEQPIVLPKLRAILK